jgi:hypothetical protein
MAPEMTAGPDQRAAQCAPLAAQNTESAGQSVRRCSCGAPLESRGSGFLASSGRIWHCPACRIVRV